MYGNITLGLDIQQKKIMFTVTPLFSPKPLPVTTSYHGAIPVIWSLIRCVEVGRLAKWR